MNAPPVSHSSPVYPKDEGIDQPEQGDGAAEREYPHDGQNEAQARHPSSGSGEDPDAEGRNEEKRQRGGAGTECSPEHRGLDHPPAVHESGKSFHKFGPKGDVGSRARIEHFLVSLSVSGVCGLILAAASPFAGFGFAIVYGTCWSARGIAAALDRLFGRPWLPHDPRIYSLMREFGAGRLTLALVALSLRFVLYDSGRDNFGLTMMALAVFAALQAAHEDIGVLGLFRPEEETRS